MNAHVSVWEESVVIPTYKACAPEKSPLFIENRAYQGSSGKVYPLPVTEKIKDVKEDVRYTAVFLENDYLKVMILPELGGRIQRALDKTNNYDFVYYNHVIKPALVGLTGPWISGGIEFNWPQHHRPSTYSPVDYTFQQNNDGSASVFLSEIDQMYGTKGMGTITLYPDKAYIEIKGQLYNNTSTPQTFLWWANPAVPVNDHTYSVFPPDVHAVMDHGKRAVSTFPIATGEYYKYDYSEGIDISMYKNVKVPTSYMAAHSDFDFIGNYDTEREAGLLHVADHHISPGKKQWTWGNADFGRAWDRNLTETDGPYIELMTGVYADNQPDFTWLKPYEEKTFTQYFMPYKGVGRVKNATRDAMVGFDLKDGCAVVSLYTSGSFDRLTLTVEKDENILYSKELSTTPDSCFQDSFETELSSPDDCKITVTTKAGRTLVSYKAARQEPVQIPDPAKPLLAPEELKSTEELFLGAQHLEQYRHATCEPADYYEEGLRRDPSDIRLNNGYGMLLLKRGHFEKAKEHFEKAIEKQTWKNPNPYYGECYYNLGLSLYYLGEYEKAFDAFYKAVWSNETQGSGFYWLACLSCRNGNYEDALAFVEQSLLRGWHNMKARALKAALLRKLEIDSASFLDESLSIDPLYMGLLFEKGLKEAPENVKNGIPVSSQNVSFISRNYLELALDYMKAGLFEEAVSVLNASPEQTPMVSYYRGYAMLQLGKTAAAEDAFSRAEHTLPDYCFPNKVEDILILQHAIETLKSAPFAHYYLGCLFYDKKQYQNAVLHWEISAEENSSYGMTWRNLSIAYYNKEQNPAKALTAMQKAFALESGNSRFLLELDQLMAKNQFSVESRLQNLEQYPELLIDRDVLYLEYITLLNDTRQHQKALECLESHTFHPWEGGEGRVIGQYRLALTQIALARMNEQQYETAIELLKKTFAYPENLGEGKLPNVQDTIAEYYIGCCYRALSKEEESVSWFKKASVGIDEPSVVLYYNDQSSETMLYQGLAHQALGNQQLSRKAFHQLKYFGEQHRFDKIAYDYFAVSLPELDVYPENIQNRNTCYCLYLSALGEIGLGNLKEAESLLDSILEIQPEYQGAIRHKWFLEELHQK